MERLALALDEPSRTIVIERGGTAWWVPVATALFVALVAAAASYYATWRFKKADVNRENAFRAADLIDEAEQIASGLVELVEDDVERVRRLVQEARVRAQPLGDSDVDDRHKATLYYISELRPVAFAQGRARHWLAQAVANVRLGLVPHLAAPKLVRRKRRPERSFPTSEELFAMPGDDGLLDALVDWRAKTGLS